MCVCFFLQERKESIGKGFGGIDHTMPFFSPAATSTVGRPGKMAPPVPPKHNSSFGDDISSRTDVSEHNLLCFISFA